LRGSYTLMAPINDQHLSKQLKPTGTMHSCNSANQFCTLDAPPGLRRWP
jgi:hypothetical protein